MVKSAWAVACLLAVVLSGASGCATATGARNSPQGERGFETGRMDNTNISVSQQAAGPQYRIGPEDLLRVSVWENKELSLDLMVRPDGKISIPLVQDVQAEGLTTVELSNQIREKLTAFVNDPQVTVIVLQVNAPKYFIIGSVAKPGLYPLRSDTSILQALSLAGGFTQFASPRSIRLIRSVEGKQVTRKVNYYDMIDDGGEGNYLLKSGDTIVVP